MSDKVFDTGEAKRSFERAEVPHDSKARRQFAHTGSGDPSGGNLSGDGEDGDAARPMHLRVAPFQGRSGQSDNQDVHRPKGTV